MNILYITALSLGSLAALFVLTKLMGYRQMSEMSMFDYINGITIGSIAAEMATSVDNSFTEPLTAMVIYAMVDIALAKITNKSLKARKWIEGEPLMLFHDGKLYEENFKKAKLDVSEFMMQCRVNGYFDPSKLHAAMLEENGKISFLPKGLNSPATAQDLSLIVKQDLICHLVISGGKIKYEALKAIHKDENWLITQLSDIGLSNIQDIILAVVDEKGKVQAFKRS